MGNVLKSSEFRDSFGAIIEDVKTEGYSIFFYPLFLYRRIIYAALVVFLFDYPLLQLIIIITATLAPVILFFML